MFGNGLRMLSAELFLLRRRISTWVLLAVWGCLALTFGYIVRYVTYTGDGTGGFGQENSLAQMLPEQVVGTMLAGYPFYGGAIALMLGVLTIGSEFGWDTLKTLFSQRPGRSQVFAAKMGALAIMLLPFVLLPFGLGATASACIAWREGAAMVGPQAGTIIEAILGAWLVLGVWAILGVLLAVATRGTSLAIGIGILYTLVIEGLISAVFDGFSLLKPIVDASLRSNTYSLLRPLGGADQGAADSAATDGPGVFNGPFVSESQALLVLAVYIAVFAGVSLWLLRRRDVA